MRMKIRLAETKDQPELVELIAHFRDPNCQEAGIIVWKFSRFARDIRRGFEFYSLNDPVPSGLDGRFFEAAIDWMNQRFLDDLWSDVKCGLRHLVKGYGWKPRTPPRFLRVKSQFLA